MLLSKCSTEEFKYIYHFGKFTGLNEIKIEDREMPKAGPNDVVLKTLKAGICGTDINILKTGNGQMGIRLDSEFGHEVAAEVVEIDFSQKMRTRV